MGDGPGFPLLQRRSFLRSAAGFGLLPAVNTGDVIETDRSVVGSTDSGMVPPLAWEWIGDHGDGLGGIQTIASAQDGSVVCAGFEADDGGTQDVLFQSIDQSGEGVWSETIGGSEDDGALDITIADNGDVVFCGATQSRGSSLFDTAVGRLKPPDSLSWFIPHGRSNTNDAAHAIVKRPAGGYVVAGGTHYLGGGSGDGVGRLLAIEEDGSVRWDETYETSYAGEFYDIVPAGNDTYAFAGTRASQNGEDERAWIGVVDGDGEIQWSETYGAAGSRIAYGVDRGHNEGFLFAGTTTPPVRDDPSAWIGKVNDAGSLEWEETYGTAGTDALVAVEQATDTGYLVAGWTRETDSTVGWLANVREGGRVEWERTFDNASDDRFQALDSTNYGYSASGSTREVGSDSSGWAVGLTNELNAPKIDETTIEIDPYPVKQGERPIVRVKIENAVEAEVRTQYTTRNGNQSQSVHSLTDTGEEWISTELPPVEEKVWVDLTIVAENRAEEETIATEYGVKSPGQGGSTDAWLLKSNNLGYYVFEYIADLAVVFGRFHNENREELNGIKLKELKSLVRARERDTNMYFGSSQGLRGKLGFRFKFYHNKESLYEVPHIKEYYNFTNKAGTLIRFRGEDRHISVISNQIGGEDIEVTFYESPGQTYLLETVVESAEVISDTPVYNADGIVVRWNGKRRDVADFYRDDNGIYRVRFSEDSRTPTLLDITEGENNDIIDIYCEETEDGNTEQKPCQNVSNTSPKPINTYISDLKSVSDVVDLSDEHDLWLGTHLGDSFSEDVLGRHSSNGQWLYGPLKTTSPSEDYAESFHIWVHELGHACGFAHPDDNLSTEHPCVMGYGSNDRINEVWAGNSPALEPIPPLSTVHHISELLNINTDGAVEASNDTDYSRENWMNTNVIEFETIGQQWLDDPQTIKSLLAKEHGDFVTMLERSTQLPFGGFRYIFELEPAVESASSLNISWGNNEGAIFIYKWEETVFGDPGYNIVSESRDDKDKIIGALIDPGSDELRDAVGSDDERFIRFRIRNKEWGEPGQLETVSATIDFKQETGDSNSVRVTVKDQVQISESFDPPDILSDLGPLTIDLKATDPEGRLVGLNDEGEYVNEIPGASASGRRINGTEWISVPEDTNVEFEVSSEAIEEFLINLARIGVSPTEDEDSSSNGEQFTVNDLKPEINAEYIVSKTKYGNNPQIVEQDGETVVEDATTRIAEKEIEPGVETIIEPETLTPLSEWENQRVDDPDPEGVASIPVEGLAGIGVVGAAMLYAASRMLSDEEEESEEDDPWS